MKKLTSNPEYFSHSASVSLSGTRFADLKDDEFETLIKLLSSNSKVEVLYLAGCFWNGISDSWIDRLSHCVASLKTLMYLDLSNNFFDAPESSLKFFRLLSFLRMPNVRVVDLSSNYCGRNHHLASGSLGNFVLNHPMLEVLSIANNLMGCMNNGDFFYFLSALQKLKLKKIDLSSNQLNHLDANQFKTLFFNLCCMASIKELQLSHNDFSEKSLSVIVNFLRDSTVAVLSLGDCSLGYMEAEIQDWIALLEIASGCNHLCKIDMYSNHLETLRYNDRQPIESTEFLMRCLEQWSHLVRVDLSDNHLDSHDEFLYALARILLIRNPDLGAGAVPKILGDFRNTGYAFDMSELIAQTKNTRKEQETSSEVRKMFLTSKISNSLDVVTQEEAFVFARRRK